MDKIQQHKDRELTDKVIPPRPICCWKNSESTGLMCILILKQDQMEGMSDHIFSVC